MKNHSHEEITYFDAITAININNGIVKLVLGNQEISGEQGKPPANPVPLKTIAMPINTFIYALAVFIKDSKNHDMITQMQEAAGLNKDPE